VALWAGDASTFGSSKAAVTAEGPWSKDGVVGSVHTVPPEDKREARLSLRAVMAFGRDPAECAAFPADCIVATRRLAYVEHRRLTVPVGLYRQCRGVVCPGETTCNIGGTCVPDSLDPAACTAEDGCVLSGDPPTPPGVDAVEVPATDAGADADAPVVLGAPGLSFKDGDPRAGLSEGLIALAPPPPSASATVLGYTLHWTKADGSAPVPLAQVALADGPSVHRLLPQTSVPAGAEFIEARALGYDTLGRSVVSPPVRLRGDNFVRKLDVGTNAGGDSVQEGLALLDPVNKKLLVIGRDPANQVSLRRCEPNGTQCAGRVLDASEDARMNTLGGAILADGPAPALVVAGVSLDFRAVVLLRCAVDGTSCTKRVVPYTPPAGRALALGGLLGVGVGLDPRDGAAVLVVSRLAFLSGPADPIDQGLHLLRCPDGSPCVRTTEGPATTVQSISGTVVSKAEAGVVYVAATLGEAGRSAILRCDPALAACTEQPLPGGGPTETSTGLVAQIDVERRQIFAAYILAGQATASLHALRCGFASGLTTPPSCTSQLVLDGVDAGGVGNTFAAVAAFPDPAGAGAGVVLVGSKVGWRVFRCGTGAPCVEMPLDGAFGAQPTTTIAPLGSRPNAKASLVIDGTGTAARVDLVAPNDDIGGRPVHMRCTEALSSCSVSDVSWTGAAAASVRIGSALGLASSPSGTVYVATTNPAIADRASLFMCDAEGSHCTDAVVESVSQEGRSAGSGVSPQVLYDQERKGVTVVSSDQQAAVNVARSGRPSAFFCDDKGVACTYQQVVTGTTSTVPYWRDPTAAFLRIETRRLWAASTDPGGAVRVSSCADIGGDCRSEPGSFGLGRADTIAVSGHLGIVRLQADAKAAAIVSCSLGAPAVCNGLGDVKVDVMGVLSERAQQIAVALREGGAKALVATVSSRDQFFGPRSVYLYLHTLPASGARPPRKLEIGVGNKSNQPVVAMVLDEPRGHAYVTAGTNTKTQLLRCGIEAGPCEVLYESADIARARPAMHLAASGKHLYVALGDDLNRARPSLLVFDL